MNNEMLTLIKTRRSARACQDTPVPEELLSAVLDAGTWAPTAHGGQSPVIVAVTDKACRDRLSQLNAAVMGSKSDPYYGAPVIVVVLAQGDNFLQDGSCVLENMMLAAHALGLSSVWVNRELEIFDSEAGKALLQEWKLPESLRGVGAIALGYSAAPAAQPAPRKEGYIVRI